VSPDDVRDQVAVAVPVSGVIVDGGVLDPVRAREQAE